VLDRLESKDTTQVMYITKLKDGTKRVANFSQNSMMEVKKMGSYKKDFEVAMFFSSQNIDFYFFFEENLGAFLSFSLSFLVLFVSLFSMLRPFEDSGILMIFEEKNSLQKFFSNGMG
jgi:hypothetical protein